MKKGNIILAICVGVFIGTLILFFILRVPSGEEGNIPELYMGNESSNFYFTYYGSPNLGLASLPVNKVKAIINCDGLIDWYKNESRRLDDLTGITSIWVIKCIELSKQDLESMDDELKEINFQINKYRECYGDCD